LWSVNSRSACTDECSYVADCYRVNTPSLSVTDVPVQLGQRSCDGLAPRAHRRAFSFFLRQEINALTLTECAVCGLSRENRDSRRAVPAESSWKRLRSCRRVASPRRTQVSGRTRRSRRSSGSSTLCTFRGPRLGSSSRMQAARPRHLPRGSSRARIASTVQIPRLPLLTKGDGLTTVRHIQYSQPPSPHLCRVCLLFIDASRSQSMGLWLFLGRITTQPPRR
jgi:hypothetical protein